MSMGGAAGQFRDEFRELYQAAGEPTLASLVRLSRQQHPPAQISDTTLSDWLAWKSVPGRQSSRVFLALVAVLQARAKSGQAYMPRSDWWWQQLLAHAQDERSAAEKSGRPPRPDVPERTPARSEKETPQPAVGAGVPGAGTADRAPGAVGAGRRSGRTDRLPEPSRGSDWSARRFMGGSEHGAPWLAQPAVGGERAGAVRGVLHHRPACLPGHPACVHRLRCWSSSQPWTGEALPAVLPEATREAYLLALLEQGARSLKGDGKATRYW